MARPKATECFIHTWTRFYSTLGSFDGSKYFCGAYLTRNGTMKPTELIHKLLTNATDLEVCKELIAEDATYVSLNYHNPDLTAVSLPTLPNPNTFSPL